MKTFKNPHDSIIGQFTYAGCRYEGIAPDTTFSVLSDGLADFLMTLFPKLEICETASAVADNEYCCSRCNKDCHSKFMKDRHEKICKAPPRGLATILKPSYIFWNFKELDRTQLTEDQLIPSSVGTQPIEKIEEEVDKDLIEGKPGMAMIGKRMESVVTDREGVDWYGKGLESDTP